MNPKLREDIKTQLLYAFDKGKEPDEETLEMIANIFEANIRSTLEACVPEEKQMLWVREDPKTEATKIAEYDSANMSFAWNECRSQFLANLEKFL